MPGEPILIVDDNPTNLKLTRILLENEGYDVRTAETAEEGLRVLESFPARLVLADIQLPGMDGLEMTRRIKRNKRNCGVLVMALTAFVSKEEEARAAGCDDYMTKPIDAVELKNRVRGMLGPSPASSPGPISPLAIPEMDELRHRFLEEGLAALAKWLGELDDFFDPAAISRTVHQWVGAGGLLGYSAISRLSREAEYVLRERPVDVGELREALDLLLAEFRAPREAGGSISAAGAVPKPETAKRPQVLIVDDDPSMLLLIRAILQNAGMECQTATDGPGGLTAARGGNWQAMVLDVNMPGMSGYDVLRALRAEKLQGAVLLLTGNERKEEIEEGIALGAADYLVKPFSPPDLVTRLKRLLGR